MDKPAQRRPRSIARRIAFVVTVIMSAIATSRMASAQLPTTMPAATRSETVLFPFDDRSILFNKGLFLTLLPGTKSPPVFLPGPPGSPDERRIYLPGSIIKVGDEYRMWYAGFSKDAKRQLCYAVSKDGFTWERPKLGLVEFNGSKDNNLLAIDGGQPMVALTCLVLYEPDAADPARRFKMVREISPENSVKVSYSADGISWTSGVGDKFVVKTEPSGLIKRNGVYYLNGHGRPVPHPIPSRGQMHPLKRMMVTHVSYDFENWTEAGTVSFRRDDLPPRPQMDYEFHRGEQVHLGASVWDRGNVVLGFYGQYHNPSNDRRDSYCDIGLIVSDDALHFKEPLPDFKIVPGAEEVDRAEPRIVQGPTLNIDDKTIHYYGIWTEWNRDSATGVRTATWPRDRLGFLSSSPGVKDAHFISGLLTPPNDARVYLNVTGLGEYSTLTVEILDEQMHPIPGYGAGEYRLDAKGSGGLRMPVAWTDRETLGKLDRPIRIRVTWGGVRPEDLRLYAVYVR